MAEHPLLSSSIFSKGASFPPLPLPLPCFHLCLIVCEFCSKFCTMLSAEDVRTANKQCVSISKKEELSPSSLQYLFSDFPSLYSAEPAWERRLLTTHSLLSPSTDCAQTLPILSPKPLPPPQMTSFHQEDKSAPCFLSGQHGGLGSCMGSRRRYCCSRRGGRSKTHMLQDESGLPCTIQHWWFPAQEQFLGFCPLKKKTQVLGDSGTATRVRSCDLALYFLISLPAALLAALSLGVLVALSHLHPLSISGPSFRCTCALLHVSLAEGVCTEARGCHCLREVLLLVACCCC